LIVDKPPFFTMPSLPQRESQQHQPANEWKLEQGLDPSLLGLRNQSSFKITAISPDTSSSHTEAQLHDDAPPDDESFVVTEERDGWAGYVEWEKYPDKKESAKRRFARYKFPPPPEFQLAPLPDTNPVLEGVRWKLWHKAIGGALTDMPEESWRTVLKVRPPLQPVTRLII
jgi:sulfite oxidase